MNINLVIVKGDFQRNKEFKFFNKSITILAGGGLHRTIVSTLASAPSCLGFEPKEKIVIVAEVNQRRC